MIRKILITSLLLISCTAFAQNRQFVFTRLSTKEGLASNIVYNVMQDKRGFMWFATANGLQRYDGRKVIYFRVPQTEENYLPSTAISQIFEDINGNFWVRAEKEVGIFDPATFRYKRAVITASQDAISRSDFELKHDSRGNVFLLLRKSVILTYNKVNNEFSDKDNPFTIPPGWKINHFVEDPVSHNYWMAGDSGVAIYDVRKKELYYRGKNPLQIPLLNDSDFNSYISALYIDRQQKAWMVSWPSHRSGERFSSYDMKHNKFVTDTSGLYNSTPSYHELHRFFQQTTGDLWAYGRRLLFHKDPSGSFQYMRNEHIDEFGIRYDIIYHIYEDREHNVWLATDQGVYIVNTAAQPFTSVRYEGPNNESGDRSATSFSEFQNKLLVGTWGSGILSFDSGLHTVGNNFVSPAAIRKDPNYSLVWTVLAERNGKRIWAGCQAGRLIIHDVLSDKTVYLNPAVFGLKTVRQLVQDRNDNIWMGTQYGHLIRWQQHDGQPDPQSFELVRELNSIVYKLYIDNKGFLWVCTSLYGVFKIDPSTGNTIAQYHSRLENGKSLSAQEATDIIQYNDSLYFIASGGLDLLNVNTGKIELLTNDLGFGTHSIRSLQLDDAGMLWIGSLNGLSRFNMKRKNFTSFSQKDGVLNGDFMPGASFRRTNGQLLFGNPNDFVVFHPSAVVRSTAPPNVSITDFKIFNTYIPPDSILKLDKVRLDPKQNSITIEFASLSFVEKDKMVYFFKLEGVDKDWVQTERLQFANYTLLPAGNYTFMVRCENGDGIPSPGITTLKIFIRPPFWQTWWFLLLSLLAVASLIYLVHRIRLNRIIDMQKVRTRIARDLHDDMGSTLSTINILSEMAKMKVHSDTAKTDEYLHKISDNSSRMMEAMDDIVWSINPLNDSMAKITARMREFATGVLEAKNIDFTFHVDEAVKELKLDMEARRDFFLLFKEAVNNLAKYSECRHAAIDLLVHHSTLIMKIRDDGKGFDVQAADNGNGMTNMKKRAQSLNGSLRIDSAPKSGTLVELEVPLAG